MILPIWLVQYTSRAITVFLGFSVLSGITGDRYISCTQGLYLPILRLLIHFSWFFMQGYFYGSCHFYHYYVVILGVHLRSFCRQSTCWHCYITEVYLIYICIGGKVCLAINNVWNMWIAYILYTYGIGVGFCHAWGLFF